MTHSLGTSGGLTQIVWIRDRDLENLFALEIPSRDQILTAKDSDESHSSPETGVNADQTLIFDSH